MSHRTDDNATSLWTAPMAWNALAWSTPGQMSTGWLDTLREWQHEMARFVEARFSADLRAQQSLAGCTCFADMAKIQQDWAAQAAKDYGEELFRLIELQSRAAGSGLMAGVAASVDSPAGKRAAMR